MAHPKAPPKPRLPNPFIVGTAPVGNGFENAPEPFGGKGDHDGDGKTGGAKPRKGKTAS